MASVWNSAGERGDAGPRRAIDDLVAELPPGDPAGVFERGLARHLPLYRRSMENYARLLIEPPQK